MSIQDILNGTGEYRVGDKVFSEWDVTTAGSIGTNAPEADEITVQGGVWDGGAFDGEIGLMFTGTWSAASGDTSTSVIRTNIVADSPYIIVGTTMYMDSFGSANGGEVTVTGNLYHEEPGAGVTSFEQDDKWLWSYRDPNGTGYKQQTGHQDYDLSDYDDDMWAVIGANAKGGTNATGATSLSRFYVTFAQVPEPASLAILALGAGAMAFRRRRR